MLAVRMADLVTEGCEFALVMQVCGHRGPAPGMTCATQGDAAGSATCNPKP